MHQISPSLLSADFSCLKESIEMINASRASFIHCDVMDGIFVPNLSFGFPVLDAVANLAKRPLDIHLMIVRPSEYISRFAAYQPEYISVHYETENHLHRTLSLIRSHGVKAGVVLNPHTPVKLLEDILEHTDLVLLMSVNPGYGGQQFIEGTYRKIEKLRKRIDKTGVDVKIEVDGGVGPANIRLLADAGADIMVAGNSVFGSPDPARAIEDLLNA